MKKYALPLALLGIVSLQACNQQTPTSQEAPAQETEAAAEVTLDTSAERLSYGIAYGLGKRMAADGVPMDADAFTTGLRDALEGAESRLTQEEIQAEMQAYQEKAAAEQAAVQAELADANLAAATAYLTENAARDGVTVTDSGLLVQSTNRGIFERDTFSTLSEAGLALRRQFACGLAARFGYSFIHWSDVLRAGEQIDLMINPTQIPPGTLEGEARPATSVFHWSASGSRRRIRSIVLRALSR